MTIESDDQDKLIRSGMSSADFTPIDNQFFREGEDNEDREWPALPLDDEEYLMVSMMGVESPDEDEQQ